MKRLLIIASIIISLVNIAFGSNPEAGEDMTVYFSDAAINDSTIFLKANKRFASLDSISQTSLIRDLLFQTNADRAVVNTSAESYLWLMEGPILTRLKWGTESNTINDYNYLQVERYGTDKWFLTIGAQLSATELSSLSFGINARGGTFLWKRILDIGLGVNMAYECLKQREFSAAVDISSRFYFTRFFSKWSLSPFVAVGLGYVIAPSSSFDPLGGIGLNWYLSKGSIDLSIQYGRASKLGISTGYTISF